MEFVMQGSDQIGHVRSTSAPPPWLPFDLSSAEVIARRAIGYTEASSAYQEPTEQPGIRQKPVRKQRDGAGEGFNLTRS
jgi:hypothetical protein